MGGLPAGEVARSASGGPSYLFTGSLRWIWRDFPSWGFPAARRVGSPWKRGFPCLEFSGILPEGLSGPAPTGGLLSCANKKVTKEVARGPLPAPWTPGAVVPDLQPLLAFRLEPSSGLSAAWVNTRLPPPLGGARRRGRGLGVVFLRRVAAGGGDLSGAARRLPFPRGG